MVMPFGLSLSKATNSHAFRQALNEQLFIGIFIKWLQNVKYRLTAPKRHANMFTAHALPRESGAYFAQRERTHTRLVPDQ
jgi:hypothetical protein